MHVLEEALGCSRSVLRTIRFLSSIDYYATLYEIRKKTGINVRRETLEKLVDLGILLKEDVLGAYKLNRDNSFLVELVNFMDRVNYEIT